MNILESVSNTNYIDSEFRLIEEYFATSKRIKEAELYIKFAKDFLNGDGDLGYIENPAEINGTLLALKYMNISTKDIINQIIKRTKNRDSKYNVLNIRNIKDCEKYIGEYNEYNDEVIGLLKNKDVIIICKIDPVAIIVNNNLYTLNYNKIEVQNDIYKAFFGNSRIEKIYFTKNEFEKVINNN